MKKKKFRSGFGDNFLIVETVKVWRRLPGDVTRISIFDSFQEWVRQTTVRNNTGIFDLGLGSG